MNAFSFSKSLDWINSQQESMVDLLEKLASVNSGTENLKGLSLTLSILENAFSCLEGTSEKIDLKKQTLVSPEGKILSLPLGQAFRITKRQEAKIKVLFSGHMDTVYSLSHPFQKTLFNEKNILKGPGVADMKGGLVVLLTALKAFEMNPLSKNIGWEILITPDEEIGSQGSKELLIQAAKNNTLGLVFEPSFPDGALVSDRKGSMNLTLVAKGKPSHAGRDFDKGYNAIVALAEVIVKISALTQTSKGITINVGKIIGGEAVNVVPEFASCKINMRAEGTLQFDETKKNLENLVKTFQKEGVSMTLFIDQIRPPKLFCEKNKALFNELNISAIE